jgi:hypothetical protein
LIPGVAETIINQHTTQAGKTWYFTIVKMTYTWVNAHAPDEKIQCNWEGHGLDDAEKGIGKAYTYSEKYFLLKFFNVPTDKDDPDAAKPEDKPVANGKGKPATKPPQTKGKKPMSAYWAELQATKTVAEYTAWWKANSASMKADLTTAEFKATEATAKLHASTLKPKEEAPAPEAPQGGGLTPYKCPGGPLDGTWTDTMYCRDNAKCQELGQCEAYQKQLEAEVA